MIISIIFPYHHFHFVISPVFALGGEANVRNDMILVTLFYCSGYHYVNVCGLSSSLGCPLRGVSLY